MRTNRETWEKITDMGECYDKCIIFIDNEVHDLPDQIGLKKSQGVFTSYHCKGMTCQKPKKNIEDFKDALSS